MAPIDSLVAPTVVARPDGLATLLSGDGDSEDSPTRCVEVQLTADSGAQSSSHPYAGVARRASNAVSLSGLAWLGGDPSPGRYATLKRTLALGERTGKGDAMRSERWPLRLDVLWEVKGANHQRVLGWHARSRGEASERVLVRLGMEGALRGSKMGCPNGLPAENAKSLRLEERPAINERWCMPGRG